jgi:hypothetical protein
VSIGLFFLLAVDFLLLLNLFFNKGAIDTLTVSNKQPSCTSELLRNKGHQSRRHGNTLYAYWYIGYKIRW